MGRIGSRVEDLDGSGEPHESQRTHRVPLPAPALEILREAREISGGAGVVFPSAHSPALRYKTISKPLKHLGIENLAVRLPLVVPGLGGGVLRDADRRRGA